jgi:hypothetical protein
LRYTEDEKDNQVNTFLLNCSENVTIDLMSQSASWDPSSGKPRRSAKSVVAEIKGLGSAKALKGMSRFGIKTNKAFGVSLPRLRALAKKIGTDHYLAQKIWQTGIHEARILASMIDDPTKVTEDQMETWQQTLTHGMS